MGKSLKKEKSDRIKELRKKYDDFLAEDKKRKERNEYILGRLDKMRADSMALRVSNGIPRNSMPMAPQMLPYYNQHQLRDDLVMQPYPSPHIILRDIPTNLNGNTEECKIIKEISKRFILIPKITTAQKPSTLPASQKCDDPDWTSKYAILDQLKKCEKENIELATNVINNKNSKNISFEDDSDVETNSVKDFKLNKNEDIVKQNNQNEPFVKAADSKEYDIDTFHRNFNEKEDAQSKYIDNHIDNKKYSNIDVSESNNVNYKNTTHGQMPIQSTEQENLNKYGDTRNIVKMNTDLSNPEDIHYNIDTNFEKNIHKEHTNEQSNNEKDCDITQEKYNTTTTSVQREKQDPQNTGNYNNNVIIDTGQIQPQTYEQKNVVEPTIADNYYDETNPNVVKSEYPNYTEQQLRENYEQYDQNATVYYTQQEHQQFQQDKQDNVVSQYQNDQIQYQDQYGQQYNQNQLQPKYESMYNPNQESQLQQGQNQIQSQCDQEQTDQYNQNQSENVVQDHHLPYDSAQIQEDQYVPAQIQESQYDPAQIQEGQYDPAQIQEGQYDQAHIREDQYDPAQIQEGQYDPAQIQEGQYDPAQIQEPQYDPAQIQEGQYDPAQLQEGQYDPAQIQESQYDPAQIQEGQYDPAQIQQGQYDPAQIQEGQYDPAQIQEGQYDLAQIQEGQYDPAQIQEGQYDQVLSEVHNPNHTEGAHEQQYDQTQVPDGQYEQDQTQYDGMYNETQQYQAGYDVNEVNEVQYNQGLQDEQYSQDVTNVQYDQDIQSQQYSQEVEYNQQYGQDEGQPPNNVNQYGEQSDQNAL